MDIGLFYLPGYPQNHFSPLRDAFPLLSKEGWASVFLVPMLFIGSGLGEAPVELTINL
jgi:hypothetical protein